MKGTRREFLGQSAKLVASGVVGGAVLARSAEGKQMPTTTQAASQEKIEKRTLGRTGLKISVIGAGTSRISENVLRYALAGGVNFIHTSSRYKGGKSIREVAKALKGTKDKDKIVIGLKRAWHRDDDKELDAALKILGRDYVDIMFFPIHDPDKVKSRWAKDLFDHWKKRGKVKFMGLTMHKSMVKCMEAALSVGWYDCLMPAYDLSRRKAYLKVFEECQKHNIGLVAMKTKISPGNTDAVPVLLRDKMVTTLCKTLRTLDDVKSYLQAATRKVERAEAERVTELAEVAALGRCVMCGECTGSCPGGLAVNDLVRSVDYYVDTMHDYDLGKETYDEIGAQANASHCLDCGECEKVCPNQVPIRHFVRRAREMFS